MENDINKSEHLYTVVFGYKGGSFKAEFLSTAEIGEQTDPMVAWGIADNAIKEVLSQIENRKPGVYPYEISIHGDFGSLAITD